jgi:hypothetical protein
MFILCVCLERASRANFDKKFRDLIKAAEWESGLDAEAEDFGVEVRFGAGWRRYGRDVGVLSFAQGWLVFEGNQASFSLRARDVEAVYRETSMVNRVYLAGSHRKVWIDLKTERPVKLREEFKAWVEEAEEPSGTPETPPLTPLAGPERAVDFVELTWYALAGWVLGLFATVNAPSLSAAVSAGGLLAGGFAYFAVGLVGRATALRRLREFTRELESLPQPAGSHQALAQPADESVRA